MTTRILRKPSDIDRLSHMLGNMTKYPYTVTITQGAPRRNTQNRLSFLWYSDIARWFGDRVPEEVRAECKVLFGFPILQENEAMEISLHRAFGLMRHEEIVQLVRDLQIPVTSLMTVKQMDRYLDEVQRYFTQQGVRLTDPDELKYKFEFES